VIVRLLDPFGLVGRVVNGIGPVGLSSASAEPAPDPVSAVEPPAEREPLAMAKKTLVQLVDDLDGSEAEETISFGLDGTSYEIDLNGEHAAALRDALAPYVGAARRTSGGASGSGRRGGGRRASAGSGSGSTSTTDRERTAQIRVWAREQGLEVNDRGRIPSKVLQAYEAAH
jgi:hypothetical protein